MKTNFLRKSAIAVLTLTTASFYFAQEQEESTGKDIEEVVIVGGVTDIAKDRKTPVAVSTLKEAAIVEKLGNQEFPEILNSTPSVYTTKSGGGFGDSRINIRGFSQENIAVMVNGMPVNDMESTKVYWSNWAGVSDVTSAMQVQRGLGASKLAIASVGGTINIITRAADKKKGGTVSIGIGNDGYKKALFAYNTGKNEKGWSSSFLMSRTSGAMYADGTSFEGYNYYLAVGYQPNKKHDFQIMVTGAPQKHDQRGVQVTIADYIKYGHGGIPNRKYNSMLGYLNGKEYVWSENYYHKPVAMFNWDWNINTKSKLATVVYASWGRGGGSGSNSPVKGSSLETYSNLQTGLLDYDAMYAANAASPTSPKILRRVSTNDHNWYGFLTNFTHKFNSNLQLSVGLDGRYYKGYHMMAVSDYLGATSYTDGGNKNVGNRVVTTSHTIGIPYFSKINAEPISYNNDGEILWGGLFGQLEYSNDKVSAFVQGSVSSQGYQRIDHFLKPGTLAVVGDPSSAMDTKTGFKYKTGFNVKAGINTNIDEHNNVFANIGYYEKQPVFGSVYPSNKNYLNPNLTNEKIFGMEIGYSFRSSSFSANLNLYRTSWKDRYLSVRNSFDEYVVSATGVVGTGKKINGSANILGITQIHMGVEFDAEYKVANYLSLTGMISLGDWKYSGNASGTYLQDTSELIIGADGKPIEAKTLYLSGVKVGDAAQFTTSAGLKLTPVKGLSISADWRYLDRLYSAVDAGKFEKPGHQGSLRLPSYNLLDVGLSYKLGIGNGQSFTFRGSIYNVLDTIYIAESRTNIHATEQDVINGNTYKGLHKNNQVYFGYGRTWSASLIFQF